MQPHPPTILLVGTDHITWRGLHALLTERLDFHLLADAQEPKQALRIAVEQRPDYILVDDAIGGLDLVPFVREMRCASSASRIVVIGTRDDLHRDTLLRLTELETAGYFLWEGLRCETVVPSLTVMRDASMVVGHRAVLDELLVERRQWLRGNELALTDDERTVLSLLVGDLTQLEIAGAMHVSEATVKRTVAVLRNKLGVHTTHALCWQAAQLGFVPCADAIPDRFRSLS